MTTMIEKMMERMINNDILRGFWISSVSTEVSARVSAAITVEAYDFTFETVDWASKLDSESDICFIYSIFFFISYTWYKFGGADQVMTNSRHSRMTRYPTISQSKMTKWRENDEGGEREQTWVWKIISKTDLRNFEVKKNFGCRISLFVIWGIRGHTNFFMDWS